MLKLHGSINWRPKLGHASPAAIDSITHHQDWYEGSHGHVEGSDHLEPEPVMVAPVLSTSSLVEQPVLRLVWSDAFVSLETAHEDTFISYSFPTTDMAARTSLPEALKDLPMDNITVVNPGRDDSETEATRERYRSVFGEILDEQFHFDGALEWTRGLQSDHRGGGLCNRKWVRLLICTPSFSYRPKPDASGCSCRATQTSSPKQFPEASRLRRQTSVKSGSQAVPIQLLPGIQPAA
ncbi:MAG: hypothetical protein OXH79_03560 [Boseongicola sp.]|nr:hypothetical protein [Boseongicola sp.]